MRWFKVIFSIFLALVFTAFVLGKTTVLGVYDVVNDYNPGTGGLTAGQVCADGCPPSATSYGGSIFSGFYIAPNGNWYPIGNPVDPVTGGGGGGGGPAETGGVCTGVYATVLHGAFVQPYVVLELNSNYATIPDVELFRQILKHVILQLVRPGLS